MRDLTLPMNSYYALPFFIILGIILRVYGLGFEGLWYDELHSVNQANPSLSLVEVISQSKQDQPPLFFILLHFWFKLTQFCELYAKLFTVIIGVFGILATYFLALQFGSKRFASLAFALISVNYFHIYYSREVRFYSLLYLLSTLSLLFYLRLLKSRESRQYIWYALITTCLLYTHYFGMVVFVSQIIITGFIFLFKREMIYSPLRFLFAFSFAAVSFLFWVPQVASDLNIQAFWIQPVSFPRFVFVYFYKYFDSLVISGVIAIAACWSFLNYTTVIRRLKTKHSFDVLLILAWVGLCLLIPYLYSIIRMPMLIVRYTIIILPAVILLSAMVIDKLPHFRNIVITFILAYSCVHIVLIRNYYTTPRKEQLRELVKEVVKEPLDSTAIFSYYAWHMNFYFSQFSPSLRAIHPETIDYEQKLKRSKYIWLLQFHEDNIGATNEQLALVNRSFEKVKTIKFIKAQGSLYQRARD